MARGKREKAREACDLLLLSIYCHISPGRVLEVRTLEVFREADLPEPFVPAHFCNRNVALLQTDGSLTIHMQKIQDLPDCWKRHNPGELRANCLLFGALI